MGLVGLLSTPEHEAGSQVLRSRENSKLINASFSGNSKVSPVSVGSNEVNPTIDRAEIDQHHL